MSQNFEMFAGDTRRLNITVVREDNGLPFNLTGTSIKWAFGKNPRREPIIEKALGGGIAIINAADGVLRVTLNPIDTLNNVGNFYHEVEITELDGTVSTVLTGSMLVKPALIPTEV